MTAESIVQRYTQQRKQKHQKKSLSLQKTQQEFETVFNKQWLVFMGVIFITISIYGFYMIHIRKRTS